MFLHDHAHILSDAAAPVQRIDPGALRRLILAAAKALRLDGYGIEPGCRADLNILAAPTWQHVLRLQQPPRIVIRGGRVLARNVLERKLERS